MERLGLLASATKSTESACAPIERIPGECPIEPRAERAEIPLRDDLGEGRQDGFAIVIEVRRDPVVHPQAHAAILDEPGVEERAQVTRRLGLGDPEGVDEVADAQLSALEEERQHLEPRWVGEGCELSGERLHLSSLAPWVCPRTAVAPRWPRRAENHDPIEFLYPVMRIYASGATHRCDAALQLGTGSRTDDRDRDVAS